MDTKDAMNGKDAKDDQDPKDANDAEDTEEAIGDRRKRERRQLQGRHELPEAGSSKSRSLRE